MNIRAMIAGFAVLTALFPVRQSLAGSITADEYLIYQGQLSKTKADFAANCTNPSMELIQAAPPCDKEEVGASATLCRPFCSNSYLNSGQPGSGILWQRRTLPDETVCSLPRSNGVLEAIPGEGNSEYTSYAKYRGLKDRWLKDFQKPGGVRDQAAAYRRTIAELMKDPGMKELKDYDVSVSELVPDIYGSLDRFVKAVHVVEKPGALTPERTALIEDSFHQWQTGCKVETELHQTCPGGDNTQYSANDLAVLVGRNRERAGERFPTLHARMQKAQDAFSKINASLWDMNRRLNELRTVTVCRALRADERELAARYTANQLREAECHLDSPSPLSDDLIRKTVGPIRAFLLQPHEEEPTKVARTEAPPAPVVPAARSSAPAEPKQGWNFNHLEDMINRPAPEPRMRGI